MSEIVNVSVVIPAFNMESYLARALDSVLAQTASARQIIVVDDGSSDLTGEIAQSYGDQVTYIRQNNSGLAAARNKGILVADSEFVAFLDADDQWLPEHLEQAERVFQMHSELKWFCAAYERVDENDSIEFVRTVDRRWVRENQISNYFDCEAAERFSSVNVMIVKRRVFDEVGLFDTTISQHGEDLDMWFRIALRNPTIGYGSLVAAKYYYRAGSITSDNRIDLPRFLSRIQRTEASALLGGSKYRQLSEPLILDWVLRAVRTSVRQSDKTILRYIIRYYGSRLPPQWRALIICCRIGPLRTANRLIDLLLNGRRKTNR